MKIKDFIFFVIVMSPVCKLNAQDVVRINPGSAKINYMSRTFITADSAELYWSGAAVRINFEGTVLKAILKDQRANNYLNIIIDNQVHRKLKLEEGKKEYVLAENLPKGKHSAVIYKITEYDRGKITFYGFLLNKDAKVLTPPPASKRRIEVYGNSITCGYSVEDTVADSPASIYENNYLSYASLAARHYNADYSFIAKSGIGITISWFPYVMSDVYDRLNPDDASSRWDFNKFTPDIVIINLFQNDSWLVKNFKHEQFIRLFGKTPPTEEFIIAAYKKFYQSIRERYPKSYIICVLGSMDATRPGSPWPGYITEAVKQVNDKKTFTYFFPFKNTPGHPKVQEQKVMADSLVHFIDRNIDW